ncbi:MAG: hypothetical protein ABFS86_07390 [Planctomycetota bacterium]
MPCTPRETAFVLVAERGGGDLKHHRTVMMERFPSLTFLAATELLEEAARVREAAFEVGARVARGETDAATARAELAARWPEVPPDALAKMIADGAAGELR